MYPDYENVDMQEWQEHNVSRASEYYTEYLDDENLDEYFEDALDDGTEWGRDFVDSSLVLGYERI